MTRSRLTALLATLALTGAPAAAFGQNAGDDQYEDPFGDDAPSSNSGSPSATPTPAPIQETAPGVSSEPEPESGSGAASASPSPAPPVAAATGDQLPRTGGEPAAVGLLGVSLVLAGVGLRLRLRPAGLADGERPA
jgi:hypothetical protein